VRLRAEPLRPITDAEVEQLWVDGVVVLRGILPTSWLDALAQPLERTIARGEAVDLGAIAGSEPSVPRFTAGVDHWRRDATFEAFALRSPLAPIAAAVLRSERVDRRRAVSVRYCGDDARYLHRPGLVAGPDLASVSDGAPVGPPAHPVAWPRA
jgi:hypothetical protein